MSLPRSYDKAHLIVFSNDAKPFRENAENYCEAALQVGFDSATSYKQEDLKETQFWADNAGILEQPRGAGYWLWKPYILLEKLREVGPNDIVVYNDVGRYTPGGFPFFPEFPHAALELCARLPKRHIHGFINNWVMQGNYIKRDCLILMNGDTDIALRAPLVSACPLVYMPTEENLAFLERWLELARNPQLLTDTPDELDKPYPFFVDHRHDQAIASLLVHRHRIHYADFSKSGIGASQSAVSREYPDARRPHIHIGYFSKMVEHALPKGFFEADELVPEEISHIIRYAVENEEIRLHKAVSQPVQAYQTTVRRMIAANAVTPDREHIQRMFNGIYPLIAFQMYELGKMREHPDIEPFWSTLEEEVQRVGQDIPRDADLSVLADKAADALLLSYDAHPEVREILLKKAVWMMLNAEARDALKSKMREHQVSGRGNVIAAFLDSGMREVLIGKEGIRQRRLREIRERVGQDFLEWLTGYLQDEAKGEEGSAQPSDDQVAGSAEA